MINDLDLQNIEHLKQRLHYLITKAHENHNNAKSYDVLANLVVIDFYDLTYSAIRLLERSIKDKELNT